MKLAIGAAAPPIRPRPKQRGARSRPAMLLPLALVIAFALRCTEAPTEESQRIIYPTPVPLHLNGEWSGTFVGGRCATPEQISVRLSHFENRIRGFFNMSCLATSTSAVELDGEVSGSFPHVWLRVNDQGACLLSRVLVTSTRITAWSRSSIGALVRSSICLARPPCGFLTDR
jgi:hypothetical protein